MMCLPSMLENGLEEVNRINSYFELSFSFCKKLHGL